MLPQDREEPQISSVAVLINAWLGFALADPSLAHFERERESLAYIGIYTRMRVTEHYGLRPFLKPQALPDLLEEERSGSTLRG